MGIAALYKQDDENVRVRVRHVMDRVRLTARCVSPVSSTQVHLNLEGNAWLLLSETRSIAYLAHVAVAGRPVPVAEGFAIETTPKGRAGSCAIVHRKAVLLAASITSYINISQALGNDLQS